MTRSVRLVAGLVLAASLGLVSGCAAASPTASDDIVEADAEDLYDGVPDECREAYPLAFAPADISDVTLQPADWPAPPSDATLCITAEAIGSATETASYATTATIDDVLAHYETSLAGYDIVRESGDENGTGYSTLSGGLGDGLGFQIRESDGGFIVAFANDTEG